MDYNGNPAPGQEPGADAVAEPRQIPASPAAENDLLASALQQPSVMGELLAAGVGTSAFTLPDARLLWPVMQAVYQRDGALGPAAITDELQRRSVLTPDLVKWVQTALDGLRLSGQWRAALASVLAARRRRDILRSASRIVDAVFAGQSARDVAPLISRLNAAAADGEPGVGSELKMVCGADVIERQIAWLWRDRIPRGMLTVLAGRPGGGKTLLACAIAAVVTTGGTFADGSPCDDGGSALILDAENPADTVLVPRLRAAGCDLRRVHVVTGKMARDADGRRHETGITLADIGVIEAAVKKVGDCKLLVVDPVGSHLAASVDEHRDNVVRSLLSPLATMAEGRNIAVLLIAHHRKQASGYADDLALGSRAFTGLCRISWHVSVDESDKSLNLLTLGKSNVGPRVPGWSFRIGGDPPVVQWVGPVEKDADDAVGDGLVKHGPAPEEREHCAAWLREFLRSGSKPVKEIELEAKGAGYSLGTLRRAREALRIVPERFGFGSGGGWTWGLPPEPNA